MLISKGVTFVDIVGVAAFADEALSIAKQKRTIDRIVHPSIPTSYCS
jgi:hypothetical protein